MSKSVGYSNDNGDGLCVDCETPTFLLVYNGIWSICEEPVKSGQPIEEIEDAELRKKAEEIYENGIELEEELTCHYCSKCKKITSININW